MLNRSAPQTQREIFAGNRAVGKISFSVAAGTSGTRLARVHEAGSLRVRFPHAQTDGTLDGVIVNTAGGMTGGDRFEVEIDTGSAARLCVTTAAAEKIYRSLGPDTDVNIKLEVGSCATLAWLPQETILFDGMRLSRWIDIDLAPDARLILAEAVVFGRSAMGETVARGSFVDRWRIRVAGRLAFAENVRIADNIAERLARRAVTGGKVAVASLVKIPGGTRDIAAIQAVGDGFVGETGISVWNGLAMVRFVAQDGAALRHDLIRALAALSDLPLPRLWTN